MVNGGTYSYEYHLKDHLGNTRVAYSDANSDGFIDEDEILQVTDYYPFGMRHEIEGYPNHANQKYLYNGKELQEETGWYDYGARMYDPALGRWHTSDPLAEAAFDWTPYRYAFCNPISFIDPDGLWEVSIVDGQLSFTAEEDDNLETLSTQTGISMDVLSEKYGDLEISEGGAYGFGDLDEVSAINDVLSSAGLSDMNCSNVAMNSNGDKQEDAWANGGDGVQQMDDAANTVKNQYNNVPESQSKTGDVVTFNYTKEEVSKYVRSEFRTLYSGKAMNNEVNRQYENSKSQPGHYGVVLLKTKDGQYVQTVLEKPGKNDVRVTQMPYSSTTFEPAPMQGDQNITYTKP